jgi:hypothetical protein
VGHHSEAFVGIDTSKLRNAVAIAEGGRRGEVRYLGEFDTTEAATRKLVTKLAAKYDTLRKLRYDAPRFALLVFRLCPAYPGNPRRYIDVGACRNR